MLIINKHFNFCCFRALAYTTLDRLCAVFLYNIDILNTSSNDGHKNFAHECAYYSDIELITERQFLALYLIFHVLVNYYYPELWQHLKLHCGYFNRQSIPDR